MPASLSRPRTVVYPENLPVSARREDIMRAISEHQVVVIAGETGSGKTTQIPKMCLELGLGERGLIGHTQPRRIAARSVAERIASELGEKIGGTVGYQVRFTSEVGADSRIKLMTDGILLAEIQHDRLLRRYSTIITGPGLWCRASGGRWARVRVGVPWTAGITEPPRRVHRPSAGSRSRSPAR